MNGLEAWDELMEMYFSEDDAEQLEWVIGSVFAEGPKKILVIQGPAMSGKSTVLNLVRDMVEDYTGPRLSVDIRHDGMSMRGGLSTAVMFVASLVPVQVDPGNADRLMHITTTGYQFEEKKHKTLVDLVRNDPSHVIDQCISIYQENNQ